ncbi:hypothetical protein HMPREF0083_00510 [Aneurinibacillus aneurinilyticus ATCC 12856]|uniref:Uncharacterized protein n=1 Tax=Aneurinibacillus aneurinilyticus ATCC 12856 TaxID=649747 RepID=U1YKR4_ANEAE|nr:hypothetical protein HMPREF0083_00510 [Aneurinibacillus aneurinilyticus ATCC 12856]
MSHLIFAIFLFYYTIDYRRTITNFKLVIVDPVFAIVRPVYVIVRLYKSSDIKGFKLPKTYKTYKTTSRSVDVDSYKIKQKNMGNSLLFIQNMGIIAL